MRWSTPFSWGRFTAILVKEFIQMRRDRLTFGMIIGIPLMQLILFGYAINTDPKNLPTAVLMADNGPYARSILQAMRTSRYIDLGYEVSSEAEAEQLLARGKVQFVVSIPPSFSRDLLRGDRPAVLIEADATDPAATANAIAHLRAVIQSGLRHELEGALAPLAVGNDPVELRVHARYNPEALTHYNIVPGLMGVVLTMTMVVITAVAITRERERGTMENLLSMPTRPLEVMVGKIVPYVLLGYIQMGLILIAARVLFDVPVAGSVPLLLTVSLLFIVANLAVGVTFSTIARNQLQAMQMSFFFFLPSLMLSGFMFPFRGMPTWAQWIGQVLPLTHFLRVVRGIMLKGNGWPEIAGELWPIGVFAAVALMIGLTRYRRTLD